MKLYLPTSSKNFSLFFETESVSPALFYEHRTFGNNRFRPSPLDISKEYLTLYSEPPLFEFNERETFPMILEFDRNILSQNLKDVSTFASDVIHNKIFLYPQTIYFDSYSFRCIFYNEKSKKETIIDSESYRNVKAVSKFTLAVENPDFFKPQPVVKNLQIPSNELAPIEQEKDKRLNYFKGFLYGYAIGELNENSPIEKDFYRIIGDIQSTFTNAKSQIIMRNTENEKSYGSKGYTKSFSSYKNYTPPKYNPYDSREDILELIGNAEKIYSSFFNTRDNIQNDDLIVSANSILTKLKLEKADSVVIDECNRFIYTLSIRNKLFEKIKKATVDFFKISTSKMGISSDEAEVSERYFKSCLFDIQRQAENNFLDVNSQPKGINLNQFIFKNSFTIFIDKGYMKLQADSEYTLLEIIIQSILKMPRPSKKGEITREEKLQLIQSVGKEISNKDDANNLQYKNDLLAFYYSIKDYTTFRIENINSVVLRNYIAFVTKIDRLDELIEFTQTKNIPDSKIAISLWCAYNGFSEISEKSSRAIFSSRNLPLINSFENYMNNVLRILERETFENYKETDNRPGIESWEKTVSKNSSAQIPIDNNTNSSLNRNKIKQDRDETSLEQKTVDNESLKKVREYLQLLQHKIWKLPSIQLMNETQKDDISKGMSVTTEKVFSKVKNEMDSFVDKAYINNYLIQSISDSNKKRRKAEYKISDKTLQSIAKELYNI